MEFGDASGSAFLDVRKRTWSRRRWTPWTAASRTASRRSPRRTSRAGCCGRRSRRYGFPASTLVSAGGGDNMMGAIGTGNVVPGP
jgi:xylulokinase